MQEIRKTRGISFAVRRVPERRRRFFVEPFPVERGVRAVRDECGERPAERAAHLRVPVFRIEDDVPLRRECPLVFHEAETMRRVFPEKEPEIRLVPHEGVRLACEKGLRRIGRLAKRRRILSETGFQRELSRRAGPHRRDFVPQVLRGRDGRVRREDGLPVQEIRRGVAVRPGVVRREDEAGQGEVRVAPLEMGEEARPAGAAQLRRIARPGREEAEQVRVKTGRRAAFLKQKRPLVRADLRHQMTGVFQRGPSASRRGTKQGRRCFYW